MEKNVINGKKRLSVEEYNKLSDKEKKKFKEMFFDEMFTPGPGDDLDVSYRVCKAGLRIFQANFWVDHHRQTENFNDNIEEQITKNAKYFRKKHKVGEFK